MRVVVLLGPGDNWIPGQTVYEQGPPIVEHLEAMRGLYNAGTLLLGGPFIDSQAGIAVLEVPDAAEGTRLMELDPAVQAGVFTFEVHRLRTYFDALAGSTRNPAQENRVPRVEPANPNARC
jgi:uncharacterized protein YciI